MNMLVEKVMKKHHIPIERIVLDANEYGEMMYSDERCLVIMVDIAEEPNWAPRFVEDWCLDVLAGRTKPTNEIGGGDET